MNQRLPNTQKSARPAKSASFDTASGGGPRQGTCNNVPFFGRQVAGWTFIALLVMLCDTACTVGQITFSTEPPSAASSGGPRLEPANVAQPADVTSPRSKPPLSPNPAPQRLPGSGSAGAAPVDGGPTQPPPGKRGANGQASAAAEAEKIIVAAAQRMLQYPTIQAKIRQQVSLYGQQIRGAGAYYQTGRDPKLKLRLELKIPTGDDIASLQHVCDGRHLWIRKSINGVGKPTRIDLLEVHREAGAMWRPGWQQALVGGLPRLMTSFRNDFQFREARPTTWRDLPVWRLRGVARVGDNQAKPNQGPLDAPSHVEVLLERTTLFPHRVTFLAAKADEDEVRLRPLVAMELYDIRIGEPIDPQRFVYAAESYDNGTDAFIERMQATALQASPTR